MTGILLFTFGVIWLRTWCEARDRADVMNRRMYNIEFCNDMVSPVDKVKCLEKFYLEEK